MEHENLGPVLHIAFENPPDSFSAASLRLARVLFSAPGDAKAQAASQALQTGE